jgi:hypothetical protein
LEGTGRRQIRGTDIKKKKKYKEDPSTTQLNTLVVSIKHFLTLFQLSIVIVLL